MGLLDTPSSDIALFANLFIFFSYIVMASFLVYVGKEVRYDKKLTLPWIIIAAGLMFISLNLLIEVIGVMSGTYILPRPMLWYVVNLIGSFALILGFAALMAERRLELTLLKKRKLEIADLMENLKEQYYKREISEADLRKLYAGLVEQLAQIEVKIKNLEKKKSGKKK